MPSDGLDEYSPLQQKLLSLSRNVLKALNIFLRGNSEGWKWPTFSDISYSLNVLWMIQIFHCKSPGSCLLFFYCKLSLYMLNLCCCHLTNTVKSFFLFCTHKALCDRVWEQLGPAYQTVSLKKAWVNEKMKHCRPRLILAHDWWTLNKWCRCSGDSWKTPLHEVLVGRGRTREVLTSPGRAQTHAGLGLCN